MKQLLLLLALAGIPAPLSAAETRPRLQSPKAIADFATKHCVACHDPKNPKGGFDFATMLIEKDVSVSPASWRSVLDRVALRDMPPKKHPTRPSGEEYQRAEEWVRGQLTAHEAIAATQRPRPMRRLNRVEYNRSVSELLGLPVSPADDFPPDDQLLGFTNIAESLNFSTTLLEQYLIAAEKVADLAFIKGDQPATKKQSHTWGNDDTKRSDGAIYPFHPNAHIQFNARDKAWWVGSHLGATIGVPVRGYYRFKLSATPRFAAKPTTIPHFRHRMEEKIILETDVPVRDGVRMNHEFVAYVNSAGRIQMTFEWVNGYHLDKSHEVFQAKSDWQTKAEKQPGLPYPFPYFDELEYEVTGPLFPDGWPMSRLQRSTAGAIAKSDARGVAEWLLPRLYRRPARGEEIDAFVNRTDRAVKSGKDFIDALKLALVQSLMSPEFLFLPEPGERGRSLDDFELASRLSFFLWAGPPDDELRELASKKQLRPAMAAQTQRMLNDWRSEHFLDRFTSEWLGLAKLTSQMPEPKLFPLFDEALRGAMMREPRAMMGHMVRENRPLAELIDAPYVFVNDRLAAHYGLPETMGGDFRKVELPKELRSRRGGLPSQAAILMMTSEQTRTSPVMRGKWALDTLFNRPPPPPPPNVSQLTPDVSAARSVMDQLRLHRAEPNCAGCHARIDPLGLALENYDAIGSWRDTEPAWEDPARPAKRDPNAKRPQFPINSRFEMGDFTGTGPAGLKAYLMANRDKFARGFTEKLTIHALGRPLTLADEKSLEAITAKATRDDLRIRSIITAIVMSDLFQVK